MSIPRIVFVVAAALTLGIEARLNPSKFKFPAHIVGINNSAANELNALSRHDTIDLGVDVFDDDTPLHIRQALANATLSDDYTLNQMITKNGRPRLLNAIAKYYSRLLNQQLDPNENVLITAGATEACYATFTGHTSPGDEWIVIEPLYSMYLPMIQMARGVARFTSLKQTKTTGRIDGDDWKLDRREMESLIGNRTKGILLNNPINPIGKVYTYDELAFIARMAKKYDLIVISDEVHEFVTHKPHVKIASLPDMFERTITIGSASKSFNVAGWRVGWAYGPASILNHLKSIHKYIVNSAPMPQQEAIAYGFEEELRNDGRPESSYFARSRRHVRQQRDLMVRTLSDIGMTPVVPDGGYCVLADWTRFRRELSFARGEAADMTFAKWLVRRVGVLGLPMSSYYGEERKRLGESYVRYCFHKTDKTIDDAIRRLKTLK